jgi:GntR family transcriptional regulator
MESPASLINFRLDSRSGVAPYRQLADQVRQAVSLGLLRPGDKLPAVREVVTQITINPNTVHRAYRELEHEGITEGRPGLGTFVTARASSSLSSSDRTMLLQELQDWADRARSTGVDDEGISALFAAVIQSKEANAT